MDASGLPLLDIELASTTTLADGRVVEWEVVGDGPDPLVWVEGGPGLPSHLARADVVFVADRFKCHLVNAPGSGRSTLPTDEAAYDVEALAAYFEAWRRAVGLGGVTVMGHSWGPLPAAAWAALYPDAVRRLIILDGYAGGGSVDPAEAEAERQRAFDRVRDRPWFHAAQKAVGEGVDQALTTELANVESFRALLPMYFADPDTPTAQAHIERIRREARFNPAVVVAWGDWRETADYRPLLRRIRCPTLVVVGEHDFICGPVWARAVAGAIPGSRLVQIPGVGHLPQYEAPEALRAAVDDWLAAEA